MSKVTCCILCTACLLCNSIILAIPITPCEQGLEYGQNQDMNKYAIPQERSIMSAMDMGDWGLAQWLLDEQKNVDNNVQYSKLHANMDSYEKEHCCSSEKSHENFYLEFDIVSFNYFID